MSDDLSEAVILYLGYGTQPYPRRSAARVRARFGWLKGWNLSAKAKRLDVMVGSTPIDWSEDDLCAVTERARQCAAEAKPCLSSAALDALAWAFSYDWK